MGRVGKVQLPLLPHLLLLGPAHTPAFICPALAVAAHLSATHQAKLLPGQNAKTALIEASVRETSLLPVLSPLVLPAVWQLEPAEARTWPAPGHPTRAGCIWGSSPAPRALLPLKHEIQLVFLKYPYLSLLLAG